jgi:subtilisin family serine protease
VATLSLAGGISTIINNLVHDLVTSYHTAVVVAAGNNGGNACLLTPASATDALTVAATSADDSMPSWSNRGSCVDLAAPGNSILSAYYTGNSDTAVMSGTSMATPLVAGVVALELQRLVLAGTAVPSPALAMSNVVALATAAKINAGSGQHLALLYSNLGMPPPSPSPRAPVRSPSPRAPPPPPPLPPPAPRSRGGSLPVLGRGNAGDTVMPLAWFTSLLLIVVPIIFL